MTEPEIVGPPFTWTLFKRNVRLWMTWSYIFSFVAVFALPLGAIYFFPTQTDRYFEWFDNLSSLQAKSADRAVVYVLFVGGPLPSLLFNWKRLKASGYRYIKNSPGNEPYNWAFFGPIFVCGLPWIGDRVPWYLVEVIRCYTLLAAQIGYISTHTFCLEDFEVANDTKAVDDAVLELFGLKDAVVPRRLRWVEFNRHVLETLKEPIGLAMIVVSTVMGILISFADVGSKHIKFTFSDVEFTSFWLMGPFIILLLGPLMFFPWIAIWQIGKTLNKAGYEQERAWLPGVLHMVWLQILPLAPGLQSNHPERIILTWIASFALQVAIMRLGAWKLKEEPHETVESCKIDGKHSEDLMKDDNVV